jgi:hypothetical protein
MNAGVVADVDAKQAQAVDVGIYPCEEEGGVKVKMKVKGYSQARQ